jgi:RimJ/RimL family protein N-acetyltransferase
MVHDLFAEHENVRIRPLIHDDIESLRLLRNNVERTKYLANIGDITPKMQEEWFERYLSDQNTISWAIDEISELNRFVGSVSLYNFRGDKCEVGKIIIDPLAGGRGIGPKAESMCMFLGYKFYGFKTVDAVVNIENQFSIKHTLKTGLKMIIENETNKPVMVKVDNSMNYCFEVGIQEFMTEYEHYQSMKIGQWMGVGSR